MPISPSSSAQAARRVVALRLRDLRKAAGLTVVELADRCGWHHSKTSRVENAVTAPSAKDIRAWTAACGAADQAEDIVTQSLNAESMYSEWRHQVRRGMKQLQDSMVQFFHDTQLFRIYSSTMVPGLLQTEGYAAALLSRIADFRGIPFNDGAEAAAARVERSRVIHEPGHRFVMLIEEAVLYAQLGDEDAMAAQLGHLLTAGALPQVSLGIVPMATRQRMQWPVETFHVYDDTLVSVEFLSAEVNITQPSEIALYLKAFEQLRGMAVHGAEARALILKAIAALN
ncbi:helix-turn-helix domain-containing protein [Streptomyces flavofungini]|uniref:Helix-turn-helix transcriptional regulator n=1 Tax=Streptomyces flavofungini TaxID=68200 RepID=A0ABS0X0M6_9ACTN|nr:helix-turn-helix transcriptional regulator [Streptomyces flavofungini]MBJ3806744.1 helix-turn-helix transcriptional regulator [Streptomyces flavofungini]GHC60820.1 transcriptional regulator [Streptomyces flavofungini]